MKIKHILLLGFIVAFSSCSTAYKTGQTPDDVYYSPAPVQTEDAYVVTEKRNSYNDRNDDSYYNRDEDLAIRRAIRDPRYRTGVTLDLGFGYNPYTYDPYGFNFSPYSYNPYAFNSYGYNPYGFNNYGYKGIYDPYAYGGYYSHNYYGNYNYGYNAFNPYYGAYYPSLYVYPGVGRVTNSTPRRVNLGAYNPSNGRVSNASNSNSRPAPVRTMTTQQNRQTGVGNVIRRVFTPSPNVRSSSSSSNNRSYNNTRQNNSRQYNNNNSNPAPVRTFDNSNSSSTRSSNNNNSSSNSGSAPVRTFRK
jgi:hypothetical protein